MAVTPVTANLGNGSSPTPYTVPTTKHFVGTAFLIGTTGGLTVNGVLIAAATAAATYGPTKGCVFTGGTVASLSGDANTKGLLCGFLYDN